MALQWGKADNIYDFRNNRGFNVKSAMFARLIWRAQKNAVDESCNHFSDINCAAVCTTVLYMPMPNLINYFFRI